MNLRLLPLALLAAPLSAVATAQPLSPQLQSGLRCAALFSIVAGEQTRQGAGDWPALATRGREFFVRISAQAMDAGGLDRPALLALVQAEAKGLQTPQSRAALKAPCLAMLDANLPVAGRGRE